MWQLEIPVSYIYLLLFHILLLMKNRFSKDNRLVYSSVITSPLPYRYFMKSCSYWCKSHLQHYWLAEIPVSLVNDFSRSSYGKIHNSPLVAEPPQGVSPIRCECHYTVQWFHLLARVKSQTPTTKTCFRCMLPLSPVSRIVKVREQFLLFW